MNLRKFFPGAMDSLRTIQIALFEGKKSMKHRHSLSVPVLYVHEDGWTEDYVGVTDPGHNYVYVPTLQRMWRNLHPLRYKGQDLYILPKNSVYTADVPYLGNVASGVIGNLNIKMKADEKLRRLWESQWDYKPNVIEFEVTAVPSTIDPRAMDLMEEDLSVSFSNDAWKVASTKSLQFLDDVPRMTIIWTALLSAAFGLISGGILAFIMNLLLLAIKK